MSKYRELRERLQPMVEELVGLEERIEQRAKNKNLSFVRQANMLQTVRKLRESILSLLWRCIDWEDLRLWVANDYIQGIDDSDIDGESLKEIAEFFEKLAEPWEGQTND